MSYVTKFHPQYPNGYQPWPVITYQGSCSEGTFESISSDCTKYNQCVNGDFVQFGCADGLHWNSALNTCDWPANAKCNMSPAGGIQQPDNQVQVVGGSTDDDDVTVIGQVTAVPAVTTPPATIPPAITAPASSQDTGMKVVCCKCNKRTF